MPSPSGKKTSRRYWLETATLATLGGALTTRIAHHQLTSRAPNSHVLTHTSTPAVTTSPEPPIIETSLAESLPISPQIEREPLSYAEFLAQFEFRYLSTSEILRPHQRTINGVHNTLPPRQLWQNMPSALKVADEIRHRLGQPLRLITSAYRCPAYNKQCGGAKNSHHTKNRALDLVFEAPPRKAFAIARELREEGFFQGGLGLYRTFIHVDTRGYDATWRA